MLDYISIHFNILHYTRCILNSINTNNYIKLKNLTDLG